MQSCLTKLAMEPGLVKQVSLVLNIVHDLVIAGKTSAQALGCLGITKLCGNLPTENCLLQLLYAYLVQWIGKCS